MQEEYRETEINRQEEMEPAYTSFAQVYDTFMDETPYRAWAAYIRQLIDRYGVSRPVKEEDGKENEKDALETERDLVVDLGCGTGKFTELMASYGYDMIGIDNSADMLAEAMERRDRLGHETMYLEQDMRSFELYGTAGTMISVCDCVNYLLTTEDLEEMFRQVNLFLYPGGLFIFDFNTLYKYRDLIGDTTIAENREDCSFIWENWFYEEDHINEYDLTLFTAIPAQEAGGKVLFEKHVETHYQRGYTLEEIRDAAEKASLEWVLAVDGDTHEEVTDTSGRILVVVREKEKV